MYDSVLSGSPAIERVWVGDSVVVPDIGHRSDPVLGLDLVFTIVGDECTIRLQGPVTARKVYPHRQDAHYVGVRFRPGVSLSGEGASLAALRDDCTGVSAVAGVDLRPLAERLLRCDHLVDRGAIVRRTVHEGAMTSEHRSPLVVAALELFNRSSARARVGVVAAELGVSERGLQRHFEEHLGVSPKQAARLVRVDRLRFEIDRRRGTSEDLAALAVAAGFYDQSHMTNEVGRVLGVTPQRLLDEGRRGI